MASTPGDPPASLRTWFVIHFVADIVFAIPLLLAPTWFLHLLGFSVVDPLTARLVGAALVGIGTESLLGRGASRASFMTMLRLKILWSVSANIGIALSIAEGAPRIAWLLQTIFLSFTSVWTYYFLRLRRAQ